MPPPRFAEIYRTQRTLELNGSKDVAAERTTMKPNARMIGCRPILPDLSHLLHIDQAMFGFGRFKAGIFGEKNDNAVRKEAGRWEGGGGGTGTGGGNGSSDYGV